MLPFGSPVIQHVYTNHINNTHTVIPGHYHFKSTTDDFLANDCILEGVSNAQSTEI
jgi:hypothetical protein